LRPVDRREVVPSRGRLKVVKRSRRWRVGREGTPVLTVVPEDGLAAGRSSLIDEIVRDGARRMLAGGVGGGCGRLSGLVRRRAGRAGRRLVVRNGRARPRQVSTAAGAVEVAAPRVNDKRTDPVTGARRRFSSVILPPWCRRTPIGAQRVGEHNASNLSSLFPACLYRLRRFFSWFGAITNTVSPALTSASTTGPSGRSIATSPTPARCSRVTSRRRSAARCATAKGCTGDPTPPGPARCPTRTASTNRLAQ
jgi:hypothetical protein